MRLLFYFKAEKDKAPMSTQAQIDANSTRYGLTANPTTISENNPHERSQYDKFKAKLLKQCLPEGELELQTFERYTFTLFRADRALKELTKPQRDWVPAMDIHTEVYLFDKIVDIPATFPRFDVRKADPSKTSAGLLAVRLMALMPEDREIVDKHRASKLAA
jgi:hypothetical protein